MDRSDADLGTVDGEGLSGHKANARSTTCAISARVLDEGNDRRGIPYL